MFVLLPLYNMLAGKYNKAVAFYGIYSNAYSHLPMLGWYLWHCRPCPAWFKD
jgi:hypothetical protein